MSGKEGTEEGNGITRAVRKLGDDLAEARQMAPLMADPLLNAIRVERLRVSITRSLWFFLCCGLGYTTAGVQAFLANGRTPADPAWWAAWLVEPAFAGILVTLLRWEAEMLARGLHVTARAATTLKRILLGATLFMNVYPTIRPPEGERFSLGAAFVHLVIPLVVFFLAEVMPVVQQLCTQAKTAPGFTVPAPVDDHQAQQEPLRTSPATLPEPARPTTAPTSTPTTRPKLPPVVLAQVRAEVDAARAAGRTPTVADVTRVVDLPVTTAALVLADLAA
ncbi:hypothetical protein L6E12_26060 [Actinokineospora sp. PR83]|uniref:hypothetical protein n=1 Tax=Actinokineospora sp. PR83 TaxID=2884908 RepID=UPI001F2CEFF1|nr:hypothetical protein [Actinokineospora sp. PR83]MCG8919244.1 hypothetical protein [Actinokineospora sp. PR83]